MKIDCNYHSKNVRRKDCKNDLNEREYRDEDKYNECRLEKEYVRALNATKLDKLYAKPLVNVYNMHNEGISHLSNYKDIFATTSYSGEIILWNLQDRKIMDKIDTDLNIMDIKLDEEKIYVVENKKVFVKRYFDTNNNILMENTFKTTKVDRWTKKKETNFTYDKVVDNMFNINTIDVFRNNIAFSTSNNISLYDLKKENFTYTKNVLNTTKVAFDKNIDNVLLACRSNDIFMEDTRAFENIFTKEVLELKKDDYISCIDKYDNNIFVGTDGGLLVYDVRNMEKEIRKFETVAGVRSVDGVKNKICCGTSDGLIYTFNIDKFNNIIYEDMYYNQRMGIVHGVTYSEDQNYIVSGSDDGSIRVWKSNSNQKTLLGYRERKNEEYKNKIKEKFKMVGEIERIRQHKTYGKDIKTKVKQKNMKKSKK